FSEIARNRQGAVVNPVSRPGRGNRSFPLLIRGGGGILCALPRQGHLSTCRQQTRFVSVPRLRKVWAGFFLDPVAGRPLPLVRVEIAHEFFTDRCPDTRGKSVLGCQ